MKDDLNSSIPKELTALIKSLTTVSEKLPGVVIIHRLSDFKVVYMSDKGLKELKITKEEVCSLTSEEYHKRYFNANDAKDYLPKILEMLNNNNDDSITFFQQVRISAEKEWVWHISSMRILLRDADNLPSYCITTSFPVEPSESFTSKINRLLEENQFLKNNLNKFKELSKRECDLLKLFALGKTSAEISESLFISIHTVETHRKNIRRKLDANSNYDLFKYASAFNLI